MFGLWGGKCVIERRVGLIFHFKLSESCHSDEGGVSKT
jgi:hypothetical protein